MSVLEHAVGVLTSAELAPICDQGPPERGLGLGATATFPSVAYSSLK